MPLIRKLKRRTHLLPLLVSGLMTSLLSSCADNKILAVYDLGQERMIKIKAGNADQNVPIMVEFYRNGQLVRECYNYSVSYEEVGRIKFDPNPIKDRANQVFLVRSGIDSLGPEAAVDYNDDTLYPCGKDTKERNTALNKIYEILERDNPELRFDRAETP